MQNYSKQDKVIYPIRFQKDFKEYYIVDNDHVNVSEIYYRNSNRIYHNLACKAEASRAIIVE